MTQARRKSTAIATLLLATGCVEQPLFPRGGVPTLDDPRPGTYAAVSAGLEHTCALTADGTAYCWGSNEFGQLGSVADTTCLRVDRRIPCRLRPTPVTGSHRFQAVSAGGAHTCGIATDGRVLCWGDNLHGALGEPTVRSAVAPIQVASAAVFTDVATGAGHSCALRTDGAAFCWGANDKGQLGNSSSGLGSAFPDSVRTTARFVALAAGGNRTCGRLRDGAVFCWGALFSPTADQTGFTREQPTPLRVVPAPAFKSVSVGVSSTCAISVQSPTHQDNDAYCWELNPAGSIGDGTAAGSQTPLLVTGGLKFTSVSAGGQHSCGIADSGLAYCWGDGMLGQLGLSPVFLTSVCGPSRVLCATQPVRVSGWRIFTQISAGQGNHVCGVTLASNVYCWGAGDMGQRGDGRAIRGDWSPVQAVSAGAL